MRKILQLILLCIIIYFNYVWSITNGKLSGFIKDAQTGEPLVGAIIKIEGTQLGAYTDEEGFYFILNIPPDDYNVTAIFLGYASVTKTNVRIKMGQTTRLNFDLYPEVIKGEKVVVVAEKPYVELDLTASKQTLRGNEINSHWGITLSEALSDLPGVNINGGIRGGYGLNELYQIDGMEMRDIGSNTNFSTLNMTTIQEVELLTGGYNAEYGRANGAIVNIVTKSASDRIHGILQYRFRPPGKYHWGKNIYGEDTFQRTIMTTPEFWDPNSEWKTEWMDEPHAGYSGDVEPFVSMTPEERAEWWKNFVNDCEFNYQMDYAKRMEWETEATVYGPITPQLGFLLSGRFKNGVPIYPSALKYNPEKTLQLSLNYKPNNNTKIELNGVYTAFANSDKTKTNFTSTEDTHHYGSDYPFVRNPYSKFAYWLWGFYSSSNYQMRPPEYASFYSLQGKLIHVFSPKTFLEVAIQYSKMDYESHFRKVMKAAFYSDLGVGNVPEKYPVSNLPKWDVSYKWAYPGDIWMNNIKTRNTAIKWDLTSQVTKIHQIKLGGLFAYQMFDKVLHDHQGNAKRLHGHLTDLSETTSHPYEGAFYIQDKMEFEGLVINAGIRLDFYNANKTVSANFFDPLMISDSTIGHVGPIGHISFDPNGKGEGYVKTKTQWALAPRIGISHPITERSVFHFMFGKFYQRPAWQKIAGPPVVRAELPPPGEGTSDLKLDPDSALVYYNFYTHHTPNPALTWEKMTQWEAGIRHSVSNKIELETTLYYRHAYDLTSKGLKQGPNSLNISKAGGSLVVEVHGDPRVPDGRSYGKYIGFFETFVNGAWSTVRGIESTLRFNSRFFNSTLTYTLSFLTVGEYHYDEVYKYFPEYNTVRGPDNDDSGRNGTDDDTWQPHNSAYIKFNIYTPKNFGPSIFGIYPFSNWRINITTSWVQGERFTYYPSDVPLGERVPNNKRWKDRWNTNMSLMYRINLNKNMKIKLFAQIKNLFNQKHLRLPSGEENKRRYFEEGKLPEQSLTREPLEWLWYMNTPRQIYYGIAFEW